MAIPGHVLTSFQVEAQVSQPLGPEWGNGVRFGHVVISAAPAHTAWSSKVREKISVEGLRVARPVRTTDGRFTVAGFRATDFVEGSPAARVDEAIGAALRLDEALSQVPAPTAPREDVWARADRAAWAEHAPPAGKQWQVAHVDFLSTCLFSGGLAPVVTDIVPSISVRPYGYSAALTLVDGLLAGAVDDCVLDRWAHVPDLAFMCERALDYRAALVAGPDAESKDSSNIQRVRGLLVS